MDPDAPPKMDCPNCEAKAPKTWMRAQGRHLVPVDETALTGAVFKHIVVQGWRCGKCGYLVLFAP